MLRSELTQVKCLEQADTWRALSTKLVTMLLVPRCQSRMMSLLKVNSCCHFRLGSPFQWGRKMVKKISSLKVFTRKSFRTLKISPKSCVFLFFCFFLYAWPLIVSVGFCSCFTCTRVCVCVSVCVRRYLKESGR